VSNILQGRRVYHDDAGTFFSDAGLTSPIGTMSGLSPGDYWKWAGGWTGICPNGLHCNLAKHAVIEEGGKISVCPSILCQYDGADGHREWHGFLENGLWRECG
jgi:hypothetical protein